MNRVIFLILVMTFSIFSWGQDSVTPQPQPQPQPQPIPQAPVLSSPIVNLNRDFSLQGGLRVRRFSSSLSNIGNLTGVSLNGLGEACDPSIEIVPTDVLDSFRNLVGPCDEMAEQIRLFNSGTTGLSMLNDLCNCYKDQSGIVNLAYQDLEKLNPQASLGQRLNIRTALEITADPKVGEEEMRENIEAQDYLLQDLRNGLKIQASLLSNDPVARTRLAGSYSQNWFESDEAKSSIEGVGRSIASDFNSRFRNATKAPPTLDVPDEEERHLDGSYPENSCVSTRDYMAFRQFPADNTFYSDLHNLSSYQEGDWDYEKLKRDLASTALQNGVINLSEAKLNLKTAPLVARIEFLHRNPLIRNLFSIQTAPDAPAVSRELRESLFQRIKSSLSMPNIAGCANQDAGSCRRAIMSKSSQYRESMRTFFDDEANKGDILKAVSFASRAEFTRSLNQARSQVNHSHHIVTSQEIASIFPSWSERSARFGMGLGSQIGSMLSGTSLNNYAEDFVHVAVPASMDASLNSSSEDSMADFARTNRMMNLVNICPKIRTSLAVTEGRSFIMNEMERAWSKEIDLESKDSDADPNTILTFEEFEDEICGGRSIAANGQKVDYETFKSSYCRSNSCASTSSVRRAFLSAYPIGASGTSAFAEAFKDFDTGFPVTNLTSEEKETVSLMNRGSYSESVRNAERSISGDFSRSLPASSSSRLAGPTSGTSSNPSSRSQSSAGFDQAQLQQSIIGGGAIAPITPQGDQPRSETVRSQLRQTETEAQGIRDEIAGLRNSLTRENSAPASSRDSSLINDLTERLARLESRLAAKERETTDLRRQLASSEDDRESGSNRQARDSSPDIRRSPAAASAAVVAQPTSQQNSGAQNLVPSAPGSFNSRASLSPASRAGSSSANSVNLSKYGVQSASSQGSITVANPSSTIDYNSLRTQSADSVISLSLSVADFNQLSANNLESLGPYLEQARSKPGEVVRLAITQQGTTNQMELFVVKNGDQISVIPANGASRGIASETPAPAVPSDRARLEQLRMELPGQ